MAQTLSLSHQHFSNAHEHRICQAGEEFAGVLSPVFDDAVCAMFSLEVEFSRVGHARDGGRANHFFEIWSACKPMPPEPAETITGYRAER